MIHVTIDNLSTVRGRESVAARGEASLTQAVIYKVHNMHAEQTVLKGVKCDY